MYNSNVMDTLFCLGRGRASGTCNIVGHSMKGIEMSEYNKTTASRSSSVSSWHKH